MAEYFKIAEDDPDLDAFERLIADYHPWYRRFKKKAENRPSYKHKNFSYKAFEQGPFPGNDAPYCPFAFSFFNNAHVHNYLLDCHFFLEKPYGRKAEHSVQQLKGSLEELVKNSDSVFAKDLNGIVLLCCNIWSGLIRDYIVENKTYIDSELTDYIVEQSTNVCNFLVDLSASEAMDVGILKTLSPEGRYGLLAKYVLQEYVQCFRTHVKKYTIFWKKEIARVAKDPKLIQSRKVVVDKGFRKKYSLYIHVVLAHQLVQPLKDLPQVPSSPTDFIFKEISKNRFSKSRDLRAQYRWLFIKAWLYSYLRKYNLTLSEVAEQISRDDDFFYMSDMPKLADFEKQVHKDEIQQARFLDLKNNFSAWKNDKSKDGYIHSQILASSKDQA
ncbi:hypothetical protein [Vibrio parahaemolyticus]|uniref:hypothetical protein n=1 Tax=Vibrio parahaemolyticus TaxID=670 RepID=UPI00235FB271|nr:hypothetical protein [Vibrio parahaemolyticus]EJC6860216.1 hypothetical protein [Vibrio parahaemolyticus]